MARRSSSVKEMIAGANSRRSVAAENARIMRIYAISGPHIAGHDGIAALTLQQPATRALASGASPSPSSQARNVIDESTTLP